jgi:outer membrane autotransporter protein
MRVVLGLSCTGCRVAGTIGIFLALAWAGSTSLRAADATQPSQPAGGTPSDGSSNPPAPPPPTPVLDSVQAGAAVTAAAQASENSLQSALREIRDHLQRRRQSDQGYGPPQGLGASPSQSNVDERAKMGATRAYQAPPSPIATWILGFADWERHDSNFGFLDGRTANTGGTIGGIDYTSYRVLGPNDAFVAGVLTGFTDVNVRSVEGIKSKLEGPSLGVYGVYVDGGFSLDFNSKVDFLSFNQVAAASFSADLRNYTTAGNISYKINAAGGWIEPTAGVIYTVTKWDDAFGKLDGHTVRVQGGARFGQAFNWAGVTVEPTLTALLYSDVVIQGGSIATVGLPDAPTDEGRVFEQLSLKVSFDFGQGLSLSTEGEVRHGDLGSGGEVVGAAGRVSIRYQW